MDDRINLSVPEIIIQSFWFWCCLQTDYCEQTCVTHLTSETSVASLRFAKSFGRTSAFQMSVVVQICKGSLWRKCCEISRLICSPVNWTFGSGCHRDVRGGCDLWNFYSESILKWTSVIHLFMHAPKKIKKQHQIHIHIHSPLQQLKTITDQSWMWFQSPNGFPDPCPTFEPYWSGAVMHHWEPMICRQRALERANVKPKPPTLTDPRRCRAESRANKLWSSRDVLVVLFYLPFRAIRCSLWYSSHMFFRWAQEWSGVCLRALCDCLFCFVWPTIPREYTWTHTVSLLCLSLSLSTSISPSLSISVDWLL